MRVYDATDVRPEAIDQQVHRDLAGDIAVAGPALPLEVNNHQVVGLHHPFAEAGGSSQNRSVIQANREIPVGCGYVLPLVHHARETRDLFTMLILGLHLPTKWIRGGEN